MCNVDETPKLSSDDDDLTSAATDTGGVAGGCSASICNVDNAPKLSSDNDDLTFDFNCSVMSSDDTVVTWAEGLPLLRIFWLTALANRLNLNDDDLTSAATVTGGVAGGCSASMCNVDDAPKVSLSAVNSTWLQPPSSRDTIAVLSILSTDNEDVLADIDGCTRLERRHKNSLILDLVVL